MLDVFAAPCLSSIVRQHPPEDAMTTDSLTEEMKKSPVFQKLLADAPQIEADFYAFKQQYRKLWDTDHSAKLTILKCHLVLEHYLTAYLEAANPASPAIGSARLTFAQKIELADHPQANFHFFVAGIKALNSMRNKVAHRLDFVPTQADLAPILEGVSIWRSAAGEPVPKGFEMLDLFTELVCGFLDGTTKMIARHGSQSGLPGLLSWYREDPNAEPGAPPNGGPAAPRDNSKVTEGPPSVS
jgi:hypothetical protein